MKKEILYLISLVLASAALFSGCVNKSDKIVPPEGSWSCWTTIRSEPTETMIYVDGEKIGLTPIKVNLWYSEPREIRIKAMPLYPETQLVQERIIQAPPLPKSLLFSMNQRKEKLTSGEEND